MTGDQLASVLHTPEHPAPEWVEIFRFSMFLPAQNMTCLIKIINKPARDLSSLEIYFWDDTAKFPERFPFAFYESTLPGLAPDLSDVMVGDQFRMQWSSSGQIRLQFSDDICDFDLTFDTAHDGYQHDATTSFVSSVRPVAITGKVRLPSWSLDLDGLGTVNRLWGSARQLDAMAIGCCAVTSDSWFYLWAPLDENGATPVAEGLVNLHGVAAPIKAVEREVLQLLDGYPFDIRLTITDDLERITTVTGATANVAELHAYPLNRLTASLVEWTLDGLPAWGGDWEIAAGSYRPDPDRYGSGLSRPRELGATKKPDHTNRDAATALLAATRELYRSIELGDFDKMQRLWERSRRASCVHPGWPIARGWPAVAESWQRKFTKRRQIVLSNLSVGIEGNLAIVHCDVDVVKNTTPASAPIIHVATTVYAHSKGRWLVISHHVSDVDRVVADSEIE